MGIGTKIKKFEAMPEQNLKQFNEVFTDSTLTGNENAEVKIGPIVGPSNVRMLLVGGEEVVHKFTVAVFLGREGRLIGEPTTTNAKLENEIMTEKEMGLEPVEYMMLQYLRGCQSSLHTQLEIADKLNKSVRGVRNTLKQMEEKEIITIVPLLNIHRLEINVNEVWI